jgi:hypothetical protein
MKDSSLRSRKRMKTVRFAHAAGTKGEMIGPAGLTESPVYRIDLRWLRAAPRNSRSAGKEGTKKGADGKNRSAPWPLSHLESRAARVGLLRCPILPAAAVVTHPDDEIKPLPHPRRAAPPSNSRS